MRLRRQAQPLDVTVAVFGDPSQPFGEGVPYPEEWRRPYAERLTIQRRVEPNANLGDVLIDVARELGVSYSDPEWGELERIPFVSFYKEGDEDEFQGPFESYLPLVDERGRVTFNNWDFNEVSFAQLVRSAEANALQGDPLRPYLILHYEVGNGVIADWPTLVNLWDLSWYVLDRIAVVGGAVGAFVGAKMMIERLRDRTRSGRDAVAAHATQWRDEQGLHPGMLGSFLRATPRTTTQIAGLLGCSQAEAEAVCWAFGLTQDEATGQWKPGDDLESQLLGGNTDLMMHGYNDYVLTDEFEKRLTQAVETGTLPRLPWEEEQERFLAEAEQQAETNTEAQSDPD